MHHALADAVLAATVPPLVGFAVAWCVAVWRDRAPAAGARRDG